MMRRTSSAHLRLKALRQWNETKRDGCGWKTAGFNPRQREDGEIKWKADWRTSGDDIYKELMVLMIHQTLTAAPLIQSSRCWRTIMSLPSTVPPTKWTKDQILVSLTEIIQHADTWINLWTWLKMATATKSETCLELSQFCRYSGKCRTVLGQSWGLTQIAPTQLSAPPSELGQLCVHRQAAWGASGCLSRYLESNMWTISPWTTSTEPARYQ